MRIVSESSGDIMSEIVEVLAKVRIDVKVQSIIAEILNDFEPVEK